MPNTPNNTTITVIAVVNAVRKKSLLPTLILLNMAIRSNENEIPNELGAALCIVFEPEIL
jgi:hypothetical protein